MMEYLDEPAYFHSPSSSSYSIYCKETFVLPLVFCQVRVPYCACIFKVELTEGVWVCIQVKLVIE